MEAPETRGAMSTVQPRQNAYFSLHSSSGPLPVAPKKSFTDKIFRKITELEPRYKIPSRPTIPIRTVHLYGTPQEIYTL